MHDFQVSVYLMMVLNFAHAMYENENKHFVILKYIFYGRFLHYLIFKISFHLNYTDEMKTSNQTRYCL